MGNNTKGKKYIHNPISKEKKIIEPERIQEYLKIGWALGYGDREGVQREIRYCKCGCGETFETHISDATFYLPGHFKNVKKVEPSLLCKCGCGEQVESERVVGDAVYKLGHRPRTKRERRVCQCGCDESFECYIWETRKFINKQHYLDYNQRTCYTNKICPTCKIVFPSENSQPTNYCSITCFNKSDFKRGSNRTSNQTLAWRTVGPWNKGLTKETSEKVLNESSIPQSLKRKGVTLEMKYGKERATEIGKHLSKGISGSLKNLKRWAAGEHNRHGKYISGKYFSVKCNIEVRFSSSYELLAVLKWEKDLSVLSYKRCPYGVQYLKENIKKYCFPDFLVTYTSEKCVMVEVKPRELLHDLENVAKFKIMQDYCQKNNLDFQIVTREDTQEVDEEDLIAAIPKIQFDNKIKEENFYKYYLSNLKAEEINVT